MRMEYPLTTHVWKLARVISNQPRGSFVSTDMIMDRQYGLGQPNVTPLDKNKYCINALQCMVTKCEMDKRGVLLFPKVVNGHTHAEYVSSRSCLSLTLNRGAQVIDLCGHISPVGQPVNSEASVIEALVGCANIMMYRSDVRYLIFYVASFQKWQTCNNIPDHYRQQSPANADLHYHSGICVIDLEPLSRGQRPLALYYEPHAYMQTPRVRTMVAGMVFWDHMTYDPCQLPPIEALSIADMLGADKIFLFLGHQTIFPICGQYSFRFIATLLDGKFPDLRSADYKVSRTQVIRKITSNEYRTQVMLSRSTHGDTYTLTHFEHTCYMPLILNFPINMDLTVTRNLPGPTIKFARVTRQSFGPLNNLQYYLTRGHYFYNLGGSRYPLHQSFP